MVSVWLLFFQTGVDLLLYTLNLMPPWPLSLTLTCGQSEPAPTSAPLWMDGALIGFSFLSLCHPMLTFFLCPFSALISPDLSFFSGTSFSPRPPPSFFIFFLLKLFPPTYYPPLSPTNLFAYIFKLKVDSSPSTYSPINLKCVTLISTHLPTPHLFIYLPTLWSHW